MDQGATEGTIDGSSDDQGAMDGASDGSGRSRANDGWCKRWIRKQRWNKKQSTEPQIVPPMDQEAIEGARWVVQEMDQEDVEGAMDGTTDGSESKEQQMVSPMDQEALMNNL